MLTGPTTRASLLASLGDGSASAWAEFVSQYEPFLALVAANSPFHRPEALAVIDRLKEATPHVKHRLSPLLPSEPAAEGLIEIIEKVQLPDGVVAEKQKQAIQRNGILNDVATCCYINGQSAENLRDFRGAAAAYHKGRLLSYGRCWDPNGWFWTPALKCSDNLERLK